MAQNPRKDPGVRQAGPKIGFPVHLGPMARLAFMGVLLFALVGVVVSVYTRYPGQDQAVRLPVTEEVRVEVPIVNLELLAKEVKDSTTLQRIELEAKPLEHLLVEAPRLLSATLRAMGLADEPPSVEQIRTYPDKYRGKPVAFRGTLEAISSFPEPHPRPGLSVYSGHVKTGEGHDVLFKVVEPIGSDIRLGSWVRIEGLFLKLRDENVPEVIRNAPLVIGSRLLPSWPLWEPVKELDPKVLDQFRDEEPPSEDGVPRIPLYHLTSFAKNLEPNSPVLLNAPDIRAEHWEQLINGEPSIARGTPFRLTGAVVKVKVYPAEENPLSIMTWSRVWLYSSTTDSMMAIWVPERVPDFKDKDAAVCTGFFLTRYQYESQDSSIRTNCLFVASDIKELVVERNPVMKYIQIGLFGLTVFFIIFFTITVRGDRKRSLAALDRRIARRRKLRVSDETPAIPNP